MLSKRIEVFCRNVDFRSGIDVYMRKFRDGDPNPYVGKQVDFNQVEDGSYVEPTMTLHIDAAQRLMDELWNCGLRPSEGSGSAGQLAAVQKHLEDMKTLAFHALKVPK
jgi:hypothetical protein